MSQRLRPVEIAILLGIALVIAGIAVPAMRTSHIARDVRRAREMLIAIRDGIRQFHQDTGMGPTRGESGDDRALYRLRSQGTVPPAAYFVRDSHQGLLEQHLLRNDRDYPSWNGPYLSELGPDPWGSAFVVVTYPLFLDDDRDCIVVSAGPNGRMDASYASPRDILPSGDDLLEVVFDKSRLESAPLY